jgi:hypothetical protein
MRKLLLIAALVLAVAPAAATAGTTSVALNASKACASLRAQIGPTAFGQTFASFGACVSSVRPLEQLNAATAVVLCRAEQADASFAASHDGKTFARFYGNGRKGVHALANCVARKTVSSSATERNVAVGQTTASALIAAQIAAANSCRTLWFDTSFAAAHNGRSFARWYGTSADLADAFGRCVVSKTLVPSAQAPTQQPPATTTTPAPGGTPPTTTTGPSNCAPAGAGGIPHIERPALCIA